MTRRGTLSRFPFLHTVNTRDNPVVKGQEIYVSYPFDNGLHFYEDLGYGEKKDVFHSGFDSVKKVKVFGVDGKYVEILDESTGALYSSEFWDYFTNEEDAREFSKARNVRFIDDIIEEARKLGISI